MSQKGERISLKVVEKVAEREGVDPTELHPPLHTAIDTEALDSLFQSTQSTSRSGMVEFRYRGYKVQISSSGEVEIGETVSFTEQSTPVEDVAGD